MSGHLINESSFIEILEMLWIINWQICGDDSKRLQNSQECSNLDKTNHWEIWKLHPIPGSRYSIKISTSALYNLSLCAFIKCHYPLVPSNKTSSGGSVQQSLQCCGLYAALLHCSMLRISVQGQIQSSTLCFNKQAIDPSSSSCVTNGCLPITKAGPTTAQHWRITFSIKSGQHT